MVQKSIATSSNSPDGSDSSLKMIRNLPSQVIPPGENKPQQDLDDLVADKVGRHAGAIIDSLIDQARKGHYQAAQFLLSELKRIRAELKDATDQETDDRLAAIADFFEAEFNKEQKSSDDRDSSCGNAASRISE